LTLALKMNHLRLLAAQGFLNALSSTAESLFGDQSFQLIKKLGFVLFGDMVAIPEA